MSGKKVLKRLWEEISKDDLKETLEKEKTFIYNEIVEAMSKKKTHSSIPT